MKTPKKSATVSVKVTKQQILDAEKWLQFVAHCQIAWEDLSPAWQEFFYAMGTTECTSDELNSLITIAIEGDKE